MPIHDDSVLREIQQLIEKIDAVDMETFKFKTPDLKQSVKDLQREALYAIVYHIQEHLNRERFGPRTEQLIKDADPELERLLAEEEEIERLARERQQQNPWGV